MTARHNSSPSRHPIHRSRWIVPALLLSALAPAPVLAQENWLKAKAMVRGNWDRVPVDYKTRDKAICTRSASGRNNKHGEAYQFAQNTWPSGPGIGLEALDHCGYALVQGFSAKHEYKSRDVKWQFDKSSDPQGTCPPPDCSACECSCFIHGQTSGGTGITSTLGAGSLLLIKPANILTPNGVVSATFRLEVWNHVQHQLIDHGQIRLTYDNATGIPTLLKTGVLQNAPAAVVPLPGGSVGVDLSGLTYTAPFSSATHSIDLSGEADGSDVDSPMEDSLTAPAILAGIEGGTTGNVWRAGVNRVQCLYDSTNFTMQGADQPISIRQIAFRLAGGLAANLVDYSNVEVYLQNAAVDFLAPSASFAANRTIALPTAPNFAGAVLTDPVGGVTPNDVFIVIPLTTPFVYDPSTGQDLLLEIVTLGGPVPLLGNTISSSFNAAAHLCNTIRSVGSTTAITGTASPFAPVVSFAFSRVPGAASNMVRGAGCYMQARSFYQLFAGHTSDLTNKTVTMAMNANGGYDVTTTPGASVVPPTSAGLALGDDEMSGAQSLPFAFVYPGGSTSTIFIDSNGSINLNGIGVSQIGGFAPALLTSPVHRLSASMQDLLPDGSLNAANVFFDVDPVMGAAYVTWLDVPCFGGQTPSTFQVALFANGTVEFRYLTLVNDSSSNGGAAITGFSLGGNAIDPGNADLTASQISTAVDEPPLTLTGVTRPITGTMWNLQVLGIPPTGVFGMEILGIGDPGINDLLLIGAPGCGLRSNLDLLSPYIPSGSTHAFSLPIPLVPGLVGLDLSSTSVMFAVPSPNAFGGLTSNGIRGTIGNN